MALTSFVFFWRSSLQLRRYDPPSAGAVSTLPAEKSRRSTAFHGPVSRLDVGREALLRGPMLVLGHAHFLLDLIQRLAFLRQLAAANSTRSFGSHTAVSDLLWTPFR